jgi:Baseplate J-like protein
MDGNIPLENLDDRKWQDLVDQAKTLAQQYAPQWTDLGPSDLGMALIELFAWLVEGMQYRLNRVPDRTYAAMLNLVGVTRDPARPAVTMLTFTPVIPPPAGSPPKIAAGTTVSTTATEKQPPIPFQTDDDLVVLPSNLSWAFKPVSGGLPQNLTTNLIRSPLSGQVLPMQSGDTLQLLFGFDTLLMTPFALNIRIAGPPLLPVVASKWLTLKWTYSVTGTPPFTTTAINVVDSTNNLQQSGTIQFPVLASWAKRTLKEVTGAPFSDNDPNASISACWLSLTVTAPPPTGATKSNFRVNLAHLLFNSVSATNLITVLPDKPEVLAPPSNGQPWQQYQLQYAPLYKIPGVRNPYRHVQISADETQSGGGTVNQTYPVVDDFPKGTDATTRCCRLAPVTGTVLFGSNDGTTQFTGTGLIPPKGSVIKVSYRAVAGGANGNVPPGVLVLFAPPAGVQSVNNPGPGRGGADQESVEDAKRRAPDLLRIRSRAVTVNDYDYLALEASTPGQESQRARSAGKAGRARRF